MLCGQQQAVSTMISYKIVRMVSSIWREDSDIAHRNRLLDFGGKKSYLFHYQSSSMAHTSNTTAAAHSAGNNNTVAAIHVGTPSPDFQEWACLPRSTSMDSPTYIRVGGMSIHQHYHAWAMNGEFKKIIRSQNMIDVARRFISCV